MVIGTHDDQASPLQAGSDDASGEKLGIVGQDRAMQRDAGIETLGDLVELIDQPREERGLGPRDDEAQPSRRAALITRSVLSRLTPPRPFSTRSTVVTLTPDSCAIVANVGLRMGPIPVWGLLTVADNFEAITSSVTCDIGSRLITICK